MIRFILVALPVSVLIGLSAPASRAQQTPDLRFAFADTTLLRDTLDLRFERLFPLADSLRILPDSLRALSIRYRLPLERLVSIADSLRMPIDSVGPVMERERYNPLASFAAGETQFKYTSQFGVRRQSTSWSNDADYGFVWGSLFVRNITQISINRDPFGDQVSINRSRISNTEAGWKFSPRFSLGARVNLSGTENLTQEIQSNSISRSQFELSMRTRQTPVTHLDADVNFFAGTFGSPIATLTEPMKSGVRAELSPRVTYSPGPWLNHNLSGRASIEFGRARLLTRPWQDTRDVSGDLSGNLSLFEDALVKMRFGYRLQRTRLEKPATFQTIDSLAGSGAPAETTIVDFLQTTPNAIRSLDATLRFQPAVDQYLDVFGRAGSTSRTLASTQGGSLRTSSADQSLGAAARFTVRGWTIDASFSTGFSLTDSPRPNNVREQPKSRPRSVEAAIRRRLARGIAFEASGGVSLTSSLTLQNRALIRASDHYDQFYRILATYNPSDRLSTRLNLDVRRTLNISLLASSSSSNSETRSYRAGWNWSYRLSRGLTATQQNDLIAHYVRFPFLPASNELRLTYRSLTTLRAVVSPRFTINVTHKTDVRPRGQYTRGADGLDYLRLADEQRDYLLSGSMAYTPTPEISLSLDPTYTSAVREITREDQAVTDRRDAGLQLTGRASLNVPLTTKGRLTGTIGRQYIANSTARFPNGVRAITRTAPETYWTGTLEVVWAL